MKNLIFSLIMMVTAALNFTVFSQNDNTPTALGMPGDNLNLYAVLDIFQKSKTLEEFERVINSRESHLNNLDLNNDNTIDYLEVVSYKEANSHAIVLRVAINSVEYQDVAVIEVNKNSSGRINIQIIGDEELYGDNYIVEPYYVETRNPGYIGNDNMIIHHYDSSILYADYWPIVIQLYSPSFRLYISPWRWGFYPPYWNPWPPVFYHDYWRYHYNYYRNRPYRRAVYIRDPIHHSYYSTRRNYSDVVRRNRRNGIYNRVYDGRDYRRPEAPSRINDRVRVRESRPLNRSLPTRATPRDVPQNRGDRPQHPSNRGNFPSEQRNQQSPPANQRQANPPTNRPSVPLNRRPFNQQSNRQQSPTNTRPAGEPASQQRTRENRHAERPVRNDRGAPPPE